MSECFIGKGADALMQCSFYNVLDILSEDDNNAYGGACAVEESTGVEWGSPYEAYMPFWNHLGHVGSGRFLCEWRDDPVTRSPVVRTTGLIASPPLEIARLLQNVKGEVWDTGIEMGSSQILEETTVEGLFVKCEESILRSPSPMARQRYQCVHSALTPHPTALGGFVYALCSITPSIPTPGDGHDLPTANTIVKGFSIEPVAGAPRFSKVSYVAQVMYAGRLPGWFVRLVATGDLASPIARLASICEYGGSVFKDTGLATIPVDPVLFDRVSPALSEKHTPDPEAAPTPSVEHSGTLGGSQILRMVSVNSESVLPAHEYPLRGSMDKSAIEVFSP